jgi:hypothetical protein
VLPAGPRPTGAPGARRVGAGRRQRAGPSRRAGYALFVVVFRRRLARFGLRPVAQPGELALLRGVEQVDAGEAVERGQHGRQLVRGFVAAPASVAAAVEQVVDRHHRWAPF